MVLDSRKSAKAKPKKKPGWQQAEEEYKAWLATHGRTDTKRSRMTKTGNSQEVKAALNAVNSSSSRQAALVRQRVDQERLARTEMLYKTPVSTVQPKVHDPKVLYKDDPEMLERELIARERKFVTAPAYNKGGDVLVTPELLKDIQAGGTRRRG